MNKERDVVLPRDPTELLDFHEDVGGMRRASGELAPFAVAIPETEIRRRDFKLDRAAEAASGDGFGRHGAHYTNASQKNNPCVFNQ